MNALNRTGYCDRKLLREDGQGGPLYSVRVTFKGELVQTREELGEQYCRQEEQIMQRPWGGKGQN